LVIQTRKKRHVFEAMLIEFRAKAITRGCAKQTWEEDKSLPYSLDQGGKNQKCYAAETTKKRANKRPIMQWKEKEQLL